MITNTKLDLTLRNSTIYPLNLFMIPRTNSNHFIVCARVLAEAEHNVYAVNTLRLWVAIFLCYSIRL